MQKNSRKVSLLLVLVSISAAGVFAAVASAQFVGPPCSPPGCGGIFQVDSNYNAGLAASSSAITPTSNLPSGGFGRLFTVSSSTNPGFSLYNVSGGSSGRYTLFTDSAGSLNFWSSTTTLQVTQGGSISGGVYYSLGNSNYYINPAANIMPYSALFAGNVGIGTTGPGSILTIVSGTRTISFSPSGTWLFSSFNSGIAAGGVDAIVFGKTSSAYNAASILYNHVADNSASNYIGFGTYAHDNGLIVNGSGNVGIGTASPQFNLDVGSGSSVASQIVNVNAAANQQAGYNIQAGGTNKWYMYRPAGSNDLRFWDGTADRVTFQNGGNVGIGTTAPTAAGLVVTANVSSIGIDVNNNRIQNVGTPINNADAATKSYVDSAITSGVSGGITGTTNYIAKFTGANTVGNSALYQSGSNVGIGTASPNYPLEVIGNGSQISFGTATGQSLFWGGTTGNNISWGAKRNTDNSTITATQTSFAGLAETYNGIRFYFNGSLTPGNTFIPSELMRLDSSGALEIGSSYVGFASPPSSGAIIQGNVGIGTASPGTNLDVNGNIQSSIYYDRDNTNYYLDLGANTMPYSAILSGSVGIGNTAPSYKLDVTGTFRATGNWSLGGAAQTDLNMGTHNISGVNKLSVTSIDPVYNIGGTKYATYVADTIGYKVEVYGKATLSPIYRSPTSIDSYGYTIDFSKAEKGSDLWLFWQTINGGKDMKDMMMTLTPQGGEANLWYDLNPAKDQIIVHGDKDVAFTYHLVAPRYDTATWPNFASTTESGVPLPIK